MGNEYIKEMFHLLANKHTLHDLVECASRIMNNPILIMDSTMKLLAVCGAEDIEDEIWNDYLAGKSKKVKYEDEKEIIETMRQVTFQKTPVLTQYRNHQVNRIVHTISYSQKTLGYIVCLEHFSPFPENISELAELVCDAFAIELQQSNNALQHEEPSHKKGLREIFTGQKNVSSFSNVFFKTLFGESYSDYYIISIPINSNEFNGSKITYLLQHIEAILGNAHAIFINNEIVVLYNTAPTKNDTVINRLSNTLDIYQLIGGVSHPFQQIEDLSFQLNIARRAAETGKSLNLSTLYRYSDVLVYDMLNTLAKTDDLRNYQCAAIDQLKHYDQKYGTSYLQTLQLYLTYCGDVSHIAKLLYTHRNTILHRIQKIEEIISMPLDNHEVRVLLSLNLKIDSLLNTNQ